jgi:hypothetical protein
MKVAQTSKNKLVYLCKMLFLKKLRKKLKKPLDIFVLLWYNKQAHKTRATLRAQKLLIEN